MVGDRAGSEVGVGIASLELEGFLLTGDGVVEPGGLRFHKYHAASQSEVKVVGDVERGAEIDVVSVAGW